MEKEESGGDNAPRAIMTPNRRSHSVNLPWATWGLSVTEREEAASMAGSLAERLETEHNAEITFPVTHFGTDQGQACRDWHRPGPTGRYYAR